MAGLTRWRPGPVAAPAAPPHQVKAAAYTATVYDWDDIGCLPDLPATIRSVTAARAVRTAGVTSQRATAWAGTTEGITIMTVGRALQLRPDGKYSPHGSWSIIAATTTVPTVPVQVRRGNVPNTYTSNTTGRSGDTEPSTLAGTQARLAAAVLPAPVQVGLVSAVPHPTVELGASVGLTIGGLIVGEQVTILRSDDTRAVALTAERGTGTPAAPDAAGCFAAVQDQPWFVTQFTYPELAPDRPATIPASGTTRQVAAW